MDYIEIDFLPVETSKSGDAIALRYSVAGVTGVHVIDGGFIDTGEQIVTHIKSMYGTTHIENVVLTHTDQDHANGLRKVLENCTVGRLWMNRPWLYAEQLLPRFHTYSSAKALESKLRTAYAAAAMLEDIADEKNIPISAPFQGTNIGPFRVLAPTMDRYLNLIADSEKTPKSLGDSLVELIEKAAKAVKTLIKGAWGGESFPVNDTSAENEMSVVQMAIIDKQRILLTGDTGRDGLTEAADYVETVGVTLPGVACFQVPHHGGRHNVNTEVLDRWLGKPLLAPAENYDWSAICSAAKADEHHPKNVVVRAMIHRGGHFAATEGRCLTWYHNIRRPTLVSVPQALYPDEYEE